MIALEVYKDEHVVLDGAAVIPADKWQLVKGCKNTIGRRLRARATARVNVLFPRRNLRSADAEEHCLAQTPRRLQGRPATSCPSMPDDAPNREGYYHDQKQKKLFVNLGGLLRRARTRSARRPH